jgi:hypothetical protein
LWHVLPLAPLLLLLLQVVVVVEWLGAGAMTRAASCSCWDTCSKQLLDVSLKLQYRIQSSMCCWHVCGVTHLISQLLQGLVLNAIHCCHDNTRRLGGMQLPAAAAR